MSIVPQITNCRQYIPQNAKSPEKSELLRAVKMWYSSTRSHMGQQPHTTWRLFQLVRHKKAPPLMDNFLYYTMKDRRKSIDEIDFAAKYLGLTGPDEEPVRP